MALTAASPRSTWSLKDLSLATHLQELEEAGVACVKIEGRMKRPEYTALVTSIYKKAIQTGAAPSPEELQQLQQVFSRSGFTDGVFYRPHRPPDVRHPFRSRRPGRPAPVRPSPQDLRGGPGSALHPGGTCPLPLCAGSP